VRYARHNAGLTALQCRNLPSSFQSSPKLTEVVRKDSYYKASLNGNLDIIDLKVTSLNASVTGIGLHSIPIDVVFYCMGLKITLLNASVTGMTLQSNSLYVSLVTSINAKIIKLKP